MVPLQVCYGWREDDDQLCGVDVVSLQSAIAKCYGEGDDQFWRKGRGALLGAVVVCYGGGGGDDQLEGSGRGAFDNTKIGFCYLGSMLV